MKGKRPIFDSLPRHRRILWVASSGGHIAEAVHLDAILQSHRDSLWVTFDSPQTRSLLAGRNVEFVDYVAPRDVRGAARAASRLANLARNEPFDACVSTGAAVAAFALPTLALRGTSSYYVESVARLDGPSLTGRLMQLVPGVRTLCQSENWASSRWRFEGSILDTWNVEAVDETADRPRRILVTLGTIRPYSFDRAVAAVRAALLPGDEVVWQLGATVPSRDLRGRVVRDMTFDELDEEFQRADVVVSHAGVGSVLQAFEHGKVPVLAVRSARYGEHVDEHQSQLARAIIAKGLALRLDLEVPSLNRDLLSRAASMRVTRQKHHRKSIS